MPLDEVLIEFTELVGEHSGEHMAQVVWSVLIRLKLAGKVHLRLVF